jgi:hypothetical protein
MRTRVVLTIAAFLVVLQLAATSAPARLVDATSHELTFAIPGRSNATPSIAADGRFIAVAWGATTSDGKADVFIVTSRNGGLTFGAPVQVNTVAGEARVSGEMPPRVGIHTTASYGGPDVVVLWTARGATTTIKLARSGNGGRAFEEPIVLPSPNAAGDRGWPAMTLDDRGNAHAIWLDHRGMAGAAGTHHQHGAAAAGADSSAAPRDPVAMAQRSALFYASAPNGAAANTASAERELTKGVCYCCKTSLIAGREGALFAAWRQVYPGSLRDIAFASSRDGGKTFSAPVPISRDGWAIDACPDDGPAMAVDAAAQMVHIVWPTVIEATSSEPRGALFYTSTRDGQTFAARTQIPTIGSAKASHPQIVRDPAGHLFVAWDEMSNGKHVAAMREIKPGATPGFGPIVTLTSDAPGMYPVLAAISDSLIAAWTTPGGPNGSTITVARVAAGS